MPLVRFATVAFAFALVFGGQAAHAGAPAGWTVAEQSGQAQVRYGAGDWKPLKQGDELTGAAEIVTGTDGRVVLHRGISTISVAADSHVEVPSPASQASDDSVFQSLGTLLYKVKPEADRKFRVKTPYLVTTIKGTVFSVTVNNLGGAVHVTEGLVDVTPTQGGAGALVSAGQTASVPAGGGADVEVQGQGSGQLPSRQPQEGPRGPAEERGAVDGPGQTVAAADRRSKGHGESTDKAGAQRGKVIFADEDTIRRDRGDNNRDRSTGSAKDDDPNHKGKRRGSNDNAAGDYRLGDATLDEAAGAGDKLASTEDLNAADGSSDTDDGAEAGNLSTATDTSSTDSTLTDTGSTDTNLTDASTTDTSLADTSLTDTSLTDTSLTDTSLTDTSLTDTSLTDTSLTDTSLTDTSLTDTSLTGSGDLTASSDITQGVGKKGNGGGGQNDQGENDQGENQQ